MRRFWHIFEFLFLFAINGVMLWFFGGYLNLLIAAMMVLFLIYSLISVHIAMPYLAAEVEMPEGYVEKNTTFHVKIRLTNRCILPFVRARIKLRAGNVFLGEMAEYEVSLPVKPLGTTEEILPLRSEYAGNIEITAFRLILCDLLSMHPQRRDISETGNIGVLPKVGMEEAYPLNDYSVGMREVSESRMTGSDFSDVSQVREYVPGDAMKDIHWKLSAKKDELMVKERLRMSSRKIMVVFALAGSAGPESDLAGRLSPADADAAADRLYGLGLFYLQRRIPVSLCYYSRRFHEICEEQAESEAEWRDAVLRAFYAQAGDGGVEAGFQKINPGQGYLLLDKSGVTEKSG